MVTAPTGVITIVASNGTPGFIGDGGPATRASLAEPFGVAVDSVGNFFIVDHSNKEIREVTASTGIINTVAGNGADGFSGDGVPATTGVPNFPFGQRVSAEDGWESVTVRAVIKT